MAKRQNKLKVFLIKNNGKRKEIKGDGKKNSFISPELEKYANSFFERNKEALKI